MPRLEFVTQGEGGAGLTSVASMKVRSYSLEQIARILGVDRQRLRYWQRLGLLPRRRDAYDWNDLNTARTVAQLYDQGIPAKHLVPHAPLLVSRALSGVSRTLVVEASDGSRELVSGQYLLDLQGDHELLVLPLAEEWVAQAEAAFDEGDCERARTLAQGALQAAPEEVTELNNLGILLLELDMPEVALETLRKAIRCPDAGARQWFNLAHGLEYVGHLEESAMALERALEFDPDFGDARFNLALTWERLGEMERAYSHWREYLRRDPLSIDADRIREHLFQVHGGTNVVPLRAT